MVEPQIFANRRGLFFEEFNIGLEVITAARTITETDVVAFASFSGDWSSIHSDAVYASQHPVGRRIAHGLAVLSIASGLAVRAGFLEDTLLVFREIDGWKFSLPIYLGDTIHLRAVVSDKRPVPRLGGGLVFFDVELLNQNAEIVQQGRWSVLVKSKDFQQGKEQAV